jgi:para-aminobenzoate synthetase/4-amino-4-deoxychorismate lyase
MLVAHTVDRVQPLLRMVEAAVAEEGLHAAGFLAYEAAPAFDPACTVHDPAGFPLLWFGLYREPEPLDLPAAADGGTTLPWLPALTAGDFARAVAAIRAEITRGATYQVNFTFPLRAPFAGDPLPFFHRLVRGQGAGLAAYIDTGRFVICSASPELFFEQAGDVLTTRPMKGTAPRGLTAADDRRQGDMLRLSAKDRAENLMILDMVRNDLARLGGPVTVPELFTVEKFPTVWQMTSVAATRTGASLTEIFAALFPCASITGAPKLQTMEIIAALENGPRRIYTGAIGHVAPGRRARFGVAIRTVLVDRTAGSAEYRVGAGITWDSDSAAEYQECLVKARILTRPLPAFDLLETLRWDPADGYALLAEHLERMAASADYFNYPWDRVQALARLAQAGVGLPSRPHRVRLLLAADGRFASAALPLEPPKAGPLRLRLARQPVAPDDPFLYHKTTHRRIYEQARAEAADGDEVLLWNGRGEVTEALNANLVVELDGRKATPPVSSGLLPGTLRGRLLAAGELTERVIVREDLQRADGLWLINSVRGWRPAILLPASGP